MKLTPLKTPEELENWIPRSNITKFSGQRFQENSGKLVCESSLSTRNQVLFCHDMAGGYLDDALYEKNDNIYAYRFYYWHLIDIFVYFSHNLVTIPPIAWIEQSHKNNVQCLGTFIIENDSYLSSLFTGDSVKRLAKKLTDIKLFYNFDGWLINIEAQAKAPNIDEILNNIKEFLKLLKQYGNEVIWYDAITTDGSLIWQNGLTELNKPFYDICGNIFINYGWKEDTLNKSIEMSNNNAQNIFVGIDCFGRGCIGGGGMNCNIAFDNIEKINRKGISKFSIALFAPGWCYQNSLKNELDGKTWIFYNFIEKYMHPWLNDRNIYRQLPEIEIDGKNVFQTNFDIGQGEANFFHGKKEEQSNYNFLNDQNFIPTGIVYKHSDTLSIKVIPCRNISYNGHSCMTIMADNVKLDDGPQFEPITIELFRIGCIMKFPGKFLLTLVTGLDEKNSIKSIWSEISLVLNYEDDIVKEIVLDDLFVSRYSPSESFTWSTFEYLFINEANSSTITIRKISIKILKFSLLELMTTEKIFLGHLEIKRILDE